jgi:hypothetical protein
MGDQQTNGQDVMLAHTLGQLMANSAENIRLHHAQLHVQERMQDELQELPHRIAAVMASHSTGKGPRPTGAGILSALDISGRELILIASALISGMMALIQGASMTGAVQEVRSQIERGE